MVRFIADVNSIAKAAADGLPFCGTSEREEKTGAFFHLLSAATAKYSADELYLFYSAEDGLVNSIAEECAKKGLCLIETDDIYHGVGALLSSKSSGNVLLTVRSDLLVYASSDTTVLLIEFDENGSHLSEVNEAVGADQLALECALGAATAQSVCEQYGPLEKILKDPLSVDFFGAGKVIEQKTSEIKARYDFLKEASALDFKIPNEADAGLEGKDLSCDAASAELSSVDTSGVAFFDKKDEKVLSEFLSEAKQRIKDGKTIIFYDLKDLLHSLGKACGFPFEIRKNGTHEEESGQLSFTQTIPEENSAAKALYDFIIATEQKAWDESVESDISYGKALHRYFDDVKIEGYIADPLNETVCKNAAEVAASHERLSKELKESGTEKLYEELELPLIFVLYDMEKTGIYMEADRLQEYGSMLEVQIRSLESKIYEEAGEEFNINSPKQLGEILFGKLGLPKGKKTKTGYSTSQKVLDELAEDYPIVADVLSYRKYAKLKSTYADGLFNCVSEDGRVHTTYQQTVTATGRLSSTDPNLQNIPIRLELGKQIRKVFLPNPDSLFIDADYSQIELRVLAHMSGDENLIKAYRADKDIHTATAALVFHVPADQVTPLQRRSAKAVNFGIVYGISSFGLGQNLSISRKQAQQYINDYFKAYPGLHSFLDGLVASAKANGFAETMYGRRRPVPELNDSQYMRRQFGERVAMNAPIQGSAADIIKIAMLHVFERLRREGMKSKLLLQVHDELLIEAPKSEEAEAKKILKEEMENASALKVPLEVDLEEGNDWYSAH